jgi:MYND finger/SET domain
MTTVSKRLDAIDKCASWLAEQQRSNTGTKLDWPYNRDAIQFRSSNDDSNVGVYAIRDIGEGEVLIEIPLDACMKEGHGLLLQSSPALKALVDDLSDHHERYLYQKSVGPRDILNRVNGCQLLLSELKMALLLSLVHYEKQAAVLEKNRAARRCEPVEAIGRALQYWSPFLDTWPPNCNEIPQNWSKQNLEQISGTPFHFFASSLQQELKRIWESSVSPAIEKSKMFGSDLPEALQKCFFDAVAFVRSRSHMSEEEADFDSRLFGGPTPILLPLIDLVNGAAEDQFINSDLERVLDGSTNLSLLATRRIAAGDEIIHGYGEMGNLQYFERFGFVPVDIKSKHPTLVPFDIIVALEVPPSLLPDIGDKFRWQQLDRRGHTRENLINSGYHNMHFGLVGNDLATRAYRTQEKVDGIIKMDLIPQVKNLFLFANGLLMDGLNDQGDKEPWEFAKVVVDVIDYNLRKIPGELVNTHDLQCLENEETPRIRRTAACARILTREIILKWRHAVCVKYSLYDWAEEANVLVIPVDSKTSCQACMASVRLRTCTRCLEVKYCSVQCQKEHWKEHKVVCKKGSV